MADIREQSTRAADAPGAEPAAVRDERFEIRDKIGAGGMGDVYRAYDRARRIEVALKVLRRVEPRRLYSFKNEFRSLAHLAHRNLVTLYELRSTESEWFFTMELIRGRSFLEHVRTAEVRSSADSGTQDLDDAATRTLVRPIDGQGTDAGTPTLVHRADGSSRGASDGAVEETEGANDREPIPGSPREAELRDALAQLAEAVCALHRAGKLHRDLKPSNVLVEDDGERIVVCDFGLVADVSEAVQRDGSGGRFERRLTGTPAYMSPEQAAGGDLGPATDWYSVGVMLHEALTGRRPFHGEVRNIIARKQVEDAAPCRTWGDGVPERLADLADLCDELLARAPAARPIGEQILRRLGLDRPAAFAHVATDPGAAPFVGRRSEFTELWKALAKVRAGAAAAVLVHAPSGMGKTTLVRRFLSSVRRAEPDAMVLEGRCYERESVPYKALDSVVDALSSALVRYDDDRARAVLPGDIGSLARLFPTLHRVASIAAASRAVPADTRELRQQAFGSLRELLGRIASQQLTIVSIDDLHWGDVDSVAFLVDLVHHPAPPPLLFIGTYRTDEAESSPLVRALLNRGASSLELGDLSLIELGALTADEARELAQGIVSESTDASASQSEALFEAVERDAAGNPLFVTEMAMAMADDESAFGRSARPSSGFASLEGLLAQRIARLPDEARALLTAAAVAGRPTPTGLLASVAGVADALAAVAVLNASHLVRARNAGGSAVDEEIEAYHDRIRETVASDLSDDQRRAFHLRLARAYEAAGATDPQSLVDHWIGAGDRERAGEYAIRAAHQAAEAAAFSQAARYFALGMRLSELDRAGIRELEVLRGDALVNAGDVLGGAELFLQAAKDSEPADSLELKRRAMMHLLRGGRLEEGLELARDVLAEVGLSLPKNRYSALVSVLYRRLALALGGAERGVDKREKPSDESRWRMDVCWSAQTGVAIVNPLYGAALQLRYIQSARRYDDPYRTALALGVELGFVAILGESQRERVETISRQAIDYARQSGNPHGLGVALGLSGLACFLTGQWRRGAELSLQAERILLHDCVGARYDSDIARMYRLASQYYAGQIRDVCRAVPLLLREAVELGNQYLANALRAWRTNEVWLAMDEPDQARRHLASAAQFAADDRAFHLHHFYSWRSECQLELYVGDANTAWERVQAGWARIKRSMLLRIESVRIESDYLKARVALAMAVDHDERRSQFLRIAAKCARRLERDGASWSIPLALVVRAPIALLGGDRAEAAALLARAIDGFEAAEMPLFVAVARLRFASLVTPADREPTLAAAQAWLDREGVRNPARMADLLIPGFER